MSIDRRIFNSHTTVIGSDPYRIVPRGVSVAMVRPLDLQIRTVAEYDMSYLRDHLRADLFINGKPAGVYAIADITDAVEIPGASFESVLSDFAPKLEKMIIDEMMVHGRHRALQAEVRALRDYIERERWWHFTPQRHWLTNARLVVRSWFSRAGRAPSAS